MAEGRLQLWPPTAATLQQLEHVTVVRRGPRAPRDRHARERPRGVGRPRHDPHRDARGGRRGRADRSTPISSVVARSCSSTRATRPAPRSTGRSRSASELGGAIRAIALTHVDADHSAGAEVLAERLGIPILVGPGGGRPLPYETRELADGERIDLGDVPLTVVATPGPRPDHVAFVVGDGSRRPRRRPRRAARLADAARAGRRARRSGRRATGSPRIAPDAPRLAGHRDGGAIIAAGGHDR